MLPVGPAHRNTLVQRGYNRRAVPELPTSRSSPTHLARRFAGRPSDRLPRLPRRSSCAARRRSSTAFARTDADSRQPTRQVPRVPVRARQIIFNPMLTGRLGLVAPGRQDVATDGRSAVGSAPVSDGDRTRSARRSYSAACWPGAAAAWLPAARRRRRPALSRRDADGQDLPAARGRGTGRSRAGTKQGPDADDPRSDAGCLAVIGSRTTGRAQEPAAQPGVRGRASVTPTGRDPVGGPPGAVSQARARWRPAEIDALYAATREVLSWANVQLRLLVPPRLEVEQRDVPARASQGGRGVPALRYAPERSVGGWIRDNRTVAPASAAEMAGIKKDPGDDLFSRGATP